MDADLVVGIDLGTTNSCIAVKRNGRIDVIPNSEGNRTTLSFVYYGKENTLVGETAKHEAASKPQNGIYEIKRLIGCPHDDPDIEASKAPLTYNVTRGTNGEIRIEVEHDNHKTHVLPEEVCARILHKLKVDAENYLDQRVTKAVITVPAYFNNNQRAATRDAAKIAGFQVLKLINEPSAAALAYIHDNSTRTQEKTILIYDLGGGTFDVSVVKMTNGSLTVLSVAGNTHLGGQDFLNRLVDYVVDEIERRFDVKVKGNKRYMWHIIGLCERAKKILTTAKSTTIVPEFFATSETVGVEITRQKFEEINDSLFKQTITIVDNCLKNRRLGPDDVDEVLLVGGSSRIPKLEALLKDYFKGKPVQRNINADEAIAIGAALEADFVKDMKRSNSLLVDVLPLSIGSVLDEESIFFNFARNTPLPANCIHNHVVKGSRQQRQGCILSVYEGNDLDCSKNVLLGAHEIKWVKPSAKNRNIEVTMYINKYGIIYVTAKGDTIKEFTIALNKGRLEDEEIRRISEQIQESSA